MPPKPLLSPRLLTSFYAHLPCHNMIILTGVVPDISNEWAHELLGGEPPDQHHQAAPDLHSLKAYMASDLPKQLPVGTRLWFDGSNDTSCGPIRVCLEGTSRAQTLSDHFSVCIWQDREHEPCCVPASGAQHTQPARQTQWCVLFLIQHCFCPLQLPLITFQFLR